MLVREISVMAVVLLLSKSYAVYHCIHLSTSAEDNDCAQMFLHKSCAHLPTEVMHPNHI